MCVYIYIYIYSKLKADVTVKTTERISQDEERGESGLPLTGVLEAGVFA